MKVQDPEPVQKGQNRAGAPAHIYPNRTDKICWFVLILYVALWLSCQTWYYGSTAQTISTVLVSIVLAALGAVVLPDRSRRAKALTPELVAPRDADTLLSQQT